MLIALDPDAFLALRLCWVESGHEAGHGHGDGLAKQRDDVADRVDEDDGVEPCVDELLRPEADHEPGHEEVHDGDHKGQDDEVLVDPAKRGALGSPLPRRELDANPVDGG